MTVWAQMKNEFTFAVCIHAVDAGQPLMAELQQPVASLSDRW
jgi:hypothetical protein